MKMRAREAIPRRNTFGSMFRSSEGVSATIPQNSWAWKECPSMRGSCLAMISRPIEASIPSTTEEGKTALNLAALKYARTSCTSPVRQMATSSSG